MNRPLGGFLQPKSVRPFRRINLNIRNGNRVYTFERIRYWILEGGDLSPAKEVEGNV
jgi:hypothetical protein